MNSHFLDKPVAMASLVLLAFALVACDQSKQTASAPAEPAQSKAASLAAVSTEKVFVVFDGPWAFVTDPKDAKMLLAIAPKTKSHLDLQVSASNKSTLAAGTYDLSVPAHSAVTAGPPDPTFVQASIDGKSLDHALAAKSERYVIRLPQPEAYVAAMRYKSRVGASYPPDSSTEKDYVTSASLRYTVNSLAGFSLAGTPDSGTFNPLLLQVDTPTITFLIDPAIGDLPLDNCSKHSREAFHDLTTLLNVTLYVDFRESASGCRDKDPQKSRTKAEITVPPLQRLLALLTRSFNGVPLVSAGAINGATGAGFLTAKVTAALREHAVATFYLFGTRPANCKAPILILTITP